MPAKKEASYRTKARLLNDISDITQYQSILDKDNFQKDESHWRQLSKNTISLFQVLIDQDLTDLVKVLNHYPRYTQWVCEHFRYAYSYSENDADIAAASALLHLGEPYFSKQFVRNVVRKLPGIDEFDTDELGLFAQRMQDDYLSWHSIVIEFYAQAYTEKTNSLSLHPLQRIALMKPLEEIKYTQDYDYQAEDRDAVLDIPYMN
jgi:hypothetical protein